jgi:hypothetical protein
MSPEFRWLGHAIGLSFECLRNADQTARFGWWSGLGWLDLGWLVLRMFCWCLLLFLLAINFLARTDPAKNEVYKNCDTEQKEEGGLDVHAGIIK